MQRQRALELAPRNPLRTDACPQFAALVQMELGGVEFTAQRLDLGQDTRRLGLHRRQSDAVRQFARFQQAQLPEDKLPAPGVADPDDDAQAAAPRGRESRGGQTGPRERASQFGFGQRHGGVGDEQGNRGVGELRATRQPLDDSAGGHNGLGAAVAQVNEGADEFQDEAVLDIEVTQSRQGQPLGVELVESPE